MSGPTIVTGATGFVGSHLLDRLEPDATLVGWYRPGGQAPDRSRHVEWQAVDVTDREAVARAIAETHPSRIYHLAGAPYVGSSWTSAVPHLRANALGTHHVLDGVRRADYDCRVLVVSSAQVYQPGDDPIDESTPLLPPNPYGLSKLMADQLALRACAEDGLDVVLARPFNHAGPRQDAVFAVSGFARQIALIEAGVAPPSIKVGNLDTRRDLTDVRDVVEAYEILMQTAPRGRPYNICSGSAWRIGDLLDELVHRASIDVGVEPDPARMRPNDTPVVQGVARRIRAELSWQPRIRVEQTLQDTLDWWREEVRAGRAEPPPR